LKKKKILQLFSGGYDSTALLIRNLKEGHEVWPLYISNDYINPIKTSIEKFVTKRIHKKLKEKMNNLTNLHSITEIKQNIGNPLGLNSAQPLYWILGLYQVSQSAIKDFMETGIDLDRKNLLSVNNKKQEFINFDEAQIAYIMQDSALSRENDIQSLWYSLLHFREDWIQNPKIPLLTFPLKNTPKSVLIQEILNYDKEILEECYSCQDPKLTECQVIERNTSKYIIRDCETCDSCLHLKENFIGLFVDKKIPRYSLTTKISKQEVEENSIDLIINKKPDCKCGIGTNIQTLGKAKSKRNTFSKILEKAVNTEKVNKINEEEDDGCLD
jgi:7-cyano-7-deazaguanine synthase in queuosine biosynthesis